MIHVWIISQISEGWCLSVTAATRDAVGTHCHLTINMEEFFVQVRILWQFQALNFALEGEQQFLSAKGSS